MFTRPITMCPPGYHHSKMVTYALWTQDVRLHIVWIVLSVTRVLKPIKVIFAYRERVSRLIMRLSTQSESAQTAHAQ